MMHLMAIDCIVGKECCVCVLACVRARACVCIRLRRHYMLFLKNTVSRVGVGLKSACNSVLSLVFSP